MLILTIFFNVVVFVVVIVAMMMVIKNAADKDKTCMKKNIIKLLCCNSNIEGLIYYQ